jgi:glycosyltransferase involved in cell wall biosynthesis
LIAVSQATRDHHLAQGVDAARCVVVHNGVDLNEFHPRRATGRLHRELGLPPEARLFASIGQLGPRKGVDVTLAAATQIAPALPHAHWLIVGERTSQKAEAREFEQRLHKLVHTPPLAGRVHFLGRREDVPDILAECELLIHAARQEPLGRVLLEAAASGVAVVATNAGGTREIFPGEAAGTVLVPPGDVRALSAAVTALYQNQQRRLALGRAARRRAEQAFDIRHAAQRLIDQYRQVLQIQAKGTGQNGTVLDRL